MSNLIEFEYSTQTDRFCAGGSCDFKRLPRKKCAAIPRQEQTRAKRVNDKMSLVDYFASVSGWGYRFRSSARMLFGASRSPAAYRHKPLSNPALRRGVHIKNTSKGAIPPRRRSIFYRCSDIKFS